MPLSGIEFRHHASNWLLLLLLLVALPACERREAADDLTAPLPVEQSIKVCCRPSDCDDSGRCDVCRRFASIGKCLPDEELRICARAIDDLGSYDGCRTPDVALEQAGGLGTGPE